jgi:hypothetical protein
MPLAEESMATLLGNTQVFQTADSTVTAMQCHGFFVVANCAPPQNDNDSDVGQFP